MYNKCPNIEELVGTEFVKYTKRSIVRRTWSNETEWIVTKSVLKPTFKNKTYQHTPLIVRTDTIQDLSKALKSKGHQLKDPIEELKRPVDVTHLWPLDTSGVGTVHSTLRTTVSEYLAKLGKETDLNIGVGMAGYASRTGRRGVESAYTEALLRTKILIVTQRDYWEDHYRLFEGLVSGTMVMTDRMISMPQGLKNGKQLIEFTSLDDLASKIEYFLSHKEERLAIAREGRRVAMQRHRAWHRIEEVIFGEALTRCSKSANCPFVVHANEQR
jgi:hypothetical protein